MQQCDMMSELLCGDLHIQKRNGLSGMEGKEVKFVTERESMSEK